VIQRILTRLGQEPVLLAIIGIAAIEVREWGALVAVISFGLLARQLSYPAVKVDAATKALKDVEVPLEAPYLGESE